MTTIHWISGTACDLFMSLYVLHHASDFGVRPAWAAGVRQRLSPANRLTLEKLFTFANIPLTWISRLPAPKNAETALKAAADLPPSRRLAVLTLKEDVRQKVEPLLQEITRKGKWNTEVRTAIIAAFGEFAQPLSRGFDVMLNTWLDPEQTGDAYLTALNEYQRVYFAEEEQRIRPEIESGLGKAKTLASRKAASALVETLTNGVSLEEAQALDDLTLMPSWWVAPLTVLERAAGGKTLLAFSIRKAAQSGTEAPEALVASLKSLGDPTRLRILHFLATGPLSPSELARRLHLRPPTVIHHLHLLRAAGLVQVTISKNLERRYAVRPATLKTIFNSLQEYLDLNGKHR